MNFVAKCNVSFEFHIIDGWSVNKTLYTFGSWAWKWKIKQVHQQLANICWLSVQPVACYKEKKKITILTIQANGFCLTIVWFVAFDVKVMRCHMINWIDENALQTNVKLKMVFENAIHFSTHSFRMVILDCNNFQSAKFFISSICFICAEKCRHCVIRLPFKHPDH